MLPDLARQRKTAQQKGPDAMIADMIGHIEGTIKKIRDSHLIVSTGLPGQGGIGYKVAVLKETSLRAVEGAPISLWTYLAVREDALDLYGFSDEEELRFFELLLTVSGIGPKSALGVLDIASVETLRSAVASANASYLTTVSGIGKKTAEKIVLELKDKMRPGDTASSGVLRGDQEALEAMRSLGYSASEARDTLRQVPAEIESGSDRLREALKLLGRK
jgi:Holliday junction DNA helicase RuvA